MHDMSSGGAERFVAAFVTGVTLCLLATSAMAYEESGRISDRIRQTRPERRNGPLREANLSDNEVREIQAISFRVFPGAILNISGVVSGCPCEEGPACADQVWVVARSGGQTSGLQLSRVGGRWAIGVVQQWWLDYQRLRSDRTLAPDKRSDAFQAMHDRFPACKLPSAASF
jgi:hypothetical protein